MKELYIMYGREKIIKKLIINSIHSFYLRGYSSFVNVIFPLSVFDSDKRKAIRLYLELMHSSGKEETSETDFKFYGSQLSTYNGKIISFDNSFELPLRPST